VACPAFSSPSRSRCVAQQVVLTQRPNPSAAQPPPCPARSHRSRSPNRHGLGAHTPGCQPPLPRALLGQLELNDIVGTHEDDPHVLPRRTPTSQGPRQPPFVASARTACPSFLPSPLTPHSLTHSLARPIATTTLAPSSWPFGVIAGRARLVGRRRRV
jgi:hypothetical protein